MKFSLIISTYNWPDALDLVFKSILCQSLMPNEIIIADDGSSAETEELIILYQQIFNTPLYHVWHEDSGFRKSIILNKAIVSAKYKYIIQIDGDVILHSKFLQNHINFLKPNTFIHGSRVLLNKKLTQNLISSKKITIPFLFFINSSNFFNSIYLPFFTYFFNFFNSSLTGTRGCNFSFFKEDFIAINGYNEDIIGWGKEDTELSARLMNLGLEKRKLKMSGIMYHLHHVSNQGFLLSANKKILESTITNNIIRCLNGCDKYM